MNCGEQERKKRNWEEKAARYVIPALLLCFLLFFFGKMQGNWDVSRNYNVRRILASRDRGNVQAVIDGNKKTLWGSGNYWEKNKAGDYILFQFADKQQFSGCSIYGRYPDQLVILYLQDGEWLPISFQETEGTCVFREPVYTDQIKICTGEEAEKKTWKVKEIRFYEKQDER